jgi:hypothetical protein
MLLRSASSPLLNCARALAEHGAGHLAVTSSPSSAARQGPALMCRAMSEGDLAGPLVPTAVKKGDGHGAATPLSASSSASFSVVEDVEEEEEEEAEYDDDVVTAGATAPVPLRRLLTTTGLDSSTLALVEQEGGGGKDDSRAPADAHYHRMIDADPGNPLLLGNYARFLKEVQRDAARARVLRARHPRQPRRRRRARALRGPRLGDHARRPPRRRLLRPRRAGRARRLVSSQLPHRAASPFSSFEIA